MFITIITSDLRPLWAIKAQFSIRPNWASKAMVLLSVCLSLTDALSVCAGGFDSLHTALCRGIPGQLVMRCLGGSSVCIICHVLVFARFYTKSTRFCTIFSVNCGRIKKTEGRMRMHSKITKVLTERLAKFSKKHATLDSTLRKMWRMKALYLLVVIPLGILILFNYVPMYGIFMAFTDYRYSKGILGSDWNGLTYFKQLFEDPLFDRAFINTLRISLLRIFLTFPFPIIFALLLNELKNAKFKRVVQSISYMPHFMSWVVVALVVNQVLSPEFGVLNSIIRLCGGEPIYFQSKREYFIPILLISSTWKGVGWGSIVYLAAITGVNQELYEAAELDGANRFQKAMYITIPSIMPIIVIQFILTFSSIMSAGFDPIFNLYNGMVMDVADVLDTFSYRVGLEDGNFGYATAIGLFQNVIGLAMVLLVNKITRRVSDYALW